MIISSGRLIVLVAYMECLEFNSVNLLSIASADRAPIIPRDASPRLIHIYPCNTATSNFRMMPLLLTIDTRKPARSPFQHTTMRAHDEGVVLSIALTSSMT